MYVDTAQYEPDSVNRVGTVEMIRKFDFFYFFEKQTYFVKTYIQYTCTVHCLRLLLILSVFPLSCLPCCTPQIKCVSNSEKNGFRHRFLVTYSSVTKKSDRNIRKSTSSWYRTYSTVRINNNRNASTHLL